MNIDTMIAQALRQMMAHFGYCGVAVVAIIVVTTALLAVKEFHNTQTK